jgi:hypothetical protein
MMPLGMSGVAAAYKADDQSLSVGKTSDFSGTNLLPKKFIPLYTFSEIKIQKEKSR